MAVSENRVIGVPNLLFDAPETDLILLDDAFQHRPIKAGLNILLTDYNNLFTRDFLTPSGTLREYRSAYKRAHTIIVTKCPEDLSENKMLKIKAEIKPLAHQQIFFSFQTYRSLTHYFNNSNIEIENLKTYDLLLFSGIAKATSFEKYLESNAQSVLNAWQFGDHHHFTLNEIKELLTEFDQYPSKNKLIISTEKDAMRLQTDEFRKLLEGYPIYYLPLQIDFFEEQKLVFNELITNYVEQNKRTF